jgi:hypothetical protein
MADQLLLNGVDSEPVPSQGERVNADFYPTDERLTKAALRTLGDRVRGHVFEPAAGSHHISDLVRQHPSVTHVYESDIRWSQDAPGDATQPEFWEYWSQQPVKNGRSQAGFDGVVTNLPFNVLPLILPLAFEHSDLVVMLARLTIQEPCQSRPEKPKPSDRGKWLDEHKDHMILQMPFNPRQKARKGSKKSDPVTFAWYAWDKNWSWDALGIMPPFQYLYGWNT